MKSAYSVVACAACIVLTCAANVANAPLTLTSSAFTDGATIPAPFAGSGACGGKNIQPPLEWSGAPADTKSFAITVFDPDAGKGRGFWHWVGYNMAPTVHELAQGGAFPGTQGANGRGDTHYDGPCPPVGDTPHHYVFTLYALDAQLSDITDGPSLLAAIKGHVLGSTTLTGRYGR
jgi:Raf kinase inhibitor-like YbhB/YbcL family protein